MIFKGTPTYPVGEIAWRVEASGGDINAYTSFDETVFYINMASSYMNEGLDILADAALNPLFDDEELTREKEVIVEEISRSEDSPTHRLSEDLFKIAFTSHPYGKSIAGTRDTVRAISRKQLISFYKKWYVGPNLILVMVGDFDSKKILPNVKRIFRKFSSKSAPQNKIPQEPKQRRPRSITRQMNIKGSYLGMAFHSPALVHPDVPTLDVLSHILSGGESSRLDQNIKDKQGLVRSIESGCYTPKDPCLFFIDAELSHGKPTQAIQSIIKEVQKIHTDLVSPSELIRAKTNLKSAQVYERETVEGLCRKLGFFEVATGDYRFEEEY
jgi:zinc protease